MHQPPPLHHVCESNAPAAASCTSDVPVAASCDAPASAAALAFFRSCSANQSSSKFPCVPCSRNQPTALPVQREG
ncbi:hypothetical protein PLICRDRAFT_42454 [Plicaturopsis crispa FD-325 SS-3]|nr:hypothetical protein PLICRDRAFT_42454 [Plicaturopsis crispa FD-325 SS-3]